MTVTGPDRDHHDARVVLWWIPVGAGGHLVRHTSRWWELVHAGLAHRRPRRLFHAALEVFVDGDRFVIEMAPAWAGSPTHDRGVVATGPVGLRFLGHSRLFRYEVRCWRSGTISDRRWAEGRTETAIDPGAARALLDRVAQVPALTWGRTVGSGGDMWNSNSLVAWLVGGGVLGTADQLPPRDGWAPGWEAGREVLADADLAAARVRRPALHGSEI